MMKEKQLVLCNLDKIHTTLLGEKRIQKNLNIQEEVVPFLIKLIQKNESVVYQKGKNYYCYVDSILITINSYNYCVITAHKKEI